MRGRCSFCLARLTFANADKHGAGKCDQFLKDTTEIKPPIMSQPTQPPTVKENLTVQPATEPIDFIKEWADKIAWDSENYVTRSGFKNHVEKLLRSFALRIEQETC